MKRAEHIKMTEREFRALKRHDYNEALKSLKKLRLGCAYMPEGNKISSLITEMERLKPVLHPWWKHA